MADLNTFTATPCGPAGQTYEITTSDAMRIPLDHLAAVKVTENPDSWTCCTIDRTSVNQTPEENVKEARDSKYGLDQCAECNNEW